MALKAILDSLEGIPEELQSEYTETDGKFYLQVEGMRPQADVDKLSRSLSAARKDAATYKQRLSLFGEKSVEDVLAELDRIPELELAAKGKLDDDAINEIVETRLKTRVAPIERENKQLRTSNEELTTQVSGFVAKERRRQIQDAVRSAATELKVLPAAVEDALLYGDRILTITEDNQIVVNEEQDGAGLSAKDWLADMKQKKPHWWGTSSGGGASGNRGGLGSGSNPWAKGSWNLTEQGRIYREDPARAESLAKAAGSRIGATSPAN